MARADNGMKVGCIAVAMVVLEMIAPLCRVKEGGVCSPSFLTYLTDKRLGERAITEVDVSKVSCQRGTIREILKQTKQEDVVFKVEVTVP